MTLKELIDEYKTLPNICLQIDYSDKKSVSANNKAVDRMYQIVSILHLEFHQEGLEAFQKLLDINENEINIWAATHLLEKLNPDKINEDKALKIIEKIVLGSSIEARGYSYWIKAWKTKNNKA